MEHYWEITNRRGTGWIGILEGSCDSQLTIFPCKTDHFTLIVLPFPKCSRVGNHTVFSLFRLASSLTNRHLKFLHIILLLDSSFPFVAEYSTVWMCHNLPSERHLGCFQVWLPVAPLQLQCLNWGPLSCQNWGKKERGNNTGIPFVLFGQQEPLSWLFVAKKMRFV